MTSRFQALYKQIRSRYTVSLKTLFICKVKRRINQQIHLVVLVTGGEMNQAFFLMSFFPFIFFLPVVVFFFFAASTRGDLISCQTAACRGGDGVDRQPGGRGVTGGNVQPQQHQEPQNGAA